MDSTNSPQMILESLNTICSKDLSQDPAARKTAVQLSQKLTRVLQDPINRATELAFVPWPYVTSRIAHDLNLYERIVEHDGPISTKELADASGGEELLINRILRCLASIDSVQEVSMDLWAATPVTKAMTIPGIKSGHRFVTSIIQAPRYLRETSHKSPTEPTDGFIQYAHQTKLNVFDFLASRPSLLHDFNTFMGNTMGARRYWVDWYPVEERLLKGLDQSKALLVDVAGGRGHDVRAFVEKYPGKGRVVLQDLRQGFAVEGGEEDLGGEIERVEYDFFTEQNVKGARAYFLHHILHDWSDKYCLAILERLYEAMTPGYSKLLIHELVLPDTGTTTLQANFDGALMTFNGGIERSKTQWIKLLEDAGFEIVEFWVDDEDADGIVEAVRKE